MLTRSSDVDVPLDVRASLAGKHWKDYIFISIHANMAKNKSASGIETYCLNSKLFTNGIQFFDKKDAKFFKKMAKYQYAQSYRLAKLVQKNVLAITKKNNTPAGDRKVKKAFSELLMGPNSIAALIEVGFLSNKQEATLLKTDQYQEVIAQGICNGILEYMQKFIFSNTF